MRHPTLVPGRHHQPPPGPAILDSAGRARQRVLALFLPVAAALYISAEALNPRGTDQPITSRATALKELTIAAHHPAQLYLSGSLTLLALGALAVSYAAIATLVRNHGSAIATVAALIGGISAFCGALINVLVGYNLAAAATAHMSPDAAAQFLVTTFNSRAYQIFAAVYFVGIFAGPVLMGLALWRSRSVPRWLAVLFASLRSTRPRPERDHAMRGERSMTKSSLSCTPERARRSTGRRARLIGGSVAAAALVSLLVPALGAARAGAADTSGTVPPVAWHQCAAGSAAAMAGGFLCGTVTAPLDYRNPSGPKIKLAVVEHLATGPGRHGVIFFNPGGPGGAGTVDLPAYIGFWPKGLLRDYDLVSWDPRGSGASTAVQCFPSAAAEGAFLGRYSVFPLGRNQQGAYIRRWQEFGRICAARNGALLRHVSTADTARDLDLLRQALGQPKLNYLGISYGTFLGATYANLFPRRVGRLVLDGNVPPEAWTNSGRPNPRLSTYLRMGSDQAAASALDAFLRICGQRSTQACAFSAGTPAATTAKWDTLLARLRRAPITLGGASYTYAEIVTTVSNALSFVQPYTTPVTGGSFPGWPQDAQGLQQLWTASNGTASATAGSPLAATVADAQSYGGVEQGFAVQCDEAPSPAASAYAGLQRLVLRRSGVIGLPDLWSNDEPCASWPVRGQDTYSGPWDAPTSPILVIGNTADPFLPLQDAIAMTRQLGNARLLVVRGYGHTAFLNPSTCAGNYMTAYFRTGTLPPTGAVCGQNLPPFPLPAG